MAITSISLSSLNGANGFRLNGEAEGDLFGRTVSNAGDINGDGFADVIIGASNARTSYVVFGKASGFDAAMDMSSLNGTNGFRLDDLGTAVSNAGDVNGDGFADVIIGAPGGHSSYVIFGKSSGFDAAMDMSTFNGTNGFRLDGAGTVVSGAGDINGDGFDDMIIGSPGDSAATLGYVVFGKASGFSPIFSLSDLDGSNGFALDSSYGHITSVSSAGDVNGDGYDDLIYGLVLPSRYYNEVAGMWSYVVFGKASGFDSREGFRLSHSFGTYDDQPPSVSSAGDINGDGFDDLIVGVRSIGFLSYPNPGPHYSGSSFVVFGKAGGFVSDLDLSTLDGTNGFRMDGVVEYDFLGGSVSGAGDVNGDGYDDLIIGAVGVDPYDISNAGASYVIFGKASGFAARIDLSNLDVTDGFRLDGVAAHDQSGGSVSAAGDINADGYDDLITGAATAGPNGSGSGASYVLFGRSEFGGGENVIVGTPGDDVLKGTSGTDIFEAGDGNDQLVGRGGADVFKAGDGNDQIIVTDLNFVSASGGADSDTLKLAGSELDLNLADFIDTIDGIETIDLTGSGSNTLTLTLQNLINLSDTTHIFTVDGDDGDRVVGLMDDWQLGGSEGNYRLFVNDGTVLRVNTAVITDNRIGMINLADLNGSNGFRLDGPAYARTGESVSNAGDVNGDGFDDLIIGGDTFRSDPNEFSYVVFGKASGFPVVQDLYSLDGSNGFRLDSDVPQEANILGSLVSTAGDVNGDGFDDLLVGALGADPNGRYSGSSYVVFGKTSGFSAAIDLSSLDGNNGFRLDGMAEGDYLGSSVSDVGDMNGDGFDDLIVGAYYSGGPNGRHSGSSFVIFGEASGFSAAIDLSSLDGNNGFRLNGEAVGDLSGCSVSSAGDVNADGFDDVIIGARGAGSSYIVFGKTSGFDPVMSLSILNGNNGFRLDGSGHSVSGAGDINGDGFDDLIVGDFGADPNGDFSGSSYVIFGKASGFSAAMDLSSLDGNNGFRLNGEAAGDMSGFSVSNAGDVNGDGFGDLIIGAIRGGVYDSGSSYVVFGKASGFDAEMNLASLNGKNGVRLEGVAGNDLSGSSVSGAGDVNGDGFDDLIIGAPDADSYYFSSGSSYIIFGSRDFGGGQLPTIPGTPDDDVLRGTSAAEIFEAGDGNDILIGRGGADVFHGGAGVEQIKIPDLSFASIDGGTGTDILHLDGKDLHLDLASMGDNIQGIETICIYGRGDNTLALTADSVLNLSDTSNTLKLHGNAGDLLTVQDDGWVDGGVKGFYHTYMNDDAVLLVGANLMIEFV